MALSAHDMPLYAGGRRAGRCLVQSLSMTVRPGQCWVVLGPNGAGKSTLLLTLAGLLPPSGGALSLDDRPLSDWAAAALAARRAWCPQHWTDPFAATVRETLALAAVSAPREGFGERELLERLDLLPLAERDVRQLSGGERQRVALAAAMCQGAPLLLLDEPTAHLDLAHQQALVALLRDWCTSGGSVVATLHDLTLAARLGTHALLLGEGTRAHAGLCTDVLQPSRLSAVFGVTVQGECSEGSWRFWVADTAPRARSGMSGEGMA